MIDTGEVFGFWVIEGPESLKKELPFEKAGLPQGALPGKRQYNMPKTP